MRIVAVCLAVSVAAMVGQAADPDFNYYRAKVEPIFTTKRPTHARCIVCHVGRTSFNLQPIPKGGTWSEADSRKNYDMILANLVDPKNPEKSLLLFHPLAQAGGGDDFHSGGHQFPTKDDPNWKTMLGWIKGAK